MSTSRPPPRSGTPPPLPPETRTVGQLVAEALRLYGRRFWRALPLGLSLAVVDQLAGPLGRGAQLLVLVTIGAPLLTASYIGAASLAADVRLTPRSSLVALALGVLVFIPAPLLALAFVLPGVAWLALVGLCVPVAVIERSAFRASFSRGIVLGRTDYVHAVGSLATLAIVFFLTRLVLFFLLRDFGEAGARVGLFLADLVISPLLFLGAALLYFDQAARAVGSQPRSERSRDADLRPALEPDRPGRPDAEVESRPAPRGEP